MSEAEEVIVESEHDLDRLLFENAPHSIPRSFEDISDYIEQKSITFRLIRNELGADLKHRGRRKGKANSVAKREQPKNYYFVPLPKNRSNFTIQEMKDLFAVFSTNGVNKIPTSSQLKTYSASIEKIQTEKEEFNKIVNQRWLQESWNRTSLIKPEIEEFISLWWEGRINRAKRYPPIYAKMTSISLTPSPTDEITLKFVAKLSSLGSAGRYRCSPEKHTWSTLETLDDLVEIERAKQSSANSKLPHHMKEISQDEVATKLAVENNAEIVTTPSAILSILGHNPISFEESWSVPVVVKECNRGEQRSKIIYMEKKLAPKSLTIVDKNNIFAKYATRTLYTEKKTDYISAIRSGEEIDITNSSSVDDISDVLQDQANKQVVYNVWECASLDGHSVLSKHHHKTFKLLIRTSIKGESLDKQGKNCPCVVLSKLDFQPEYGAEVVSFKEVMREWLSVTLRRDSVLHRVRIDPIRGETVMTEIKTASDLVHDCKRIYSRSPHQQLGILQTVFETVTGLPPGSYLLDHRPSDKGFMFLYHHQTNGKSYGTMNLSEIYSSIDVKSSSPHNAAWIPIDSTVITPTLEYMSRIPCTLPPSTSKGKSKVIEETPPKKKKKKKKKTTKRTKPSITQGSTV